MTRPVMDVSWGLLRHEAHLRNALKSGENCALRFVFLLFVAHFSFYHTRARARAAGRLGEGEGEGKGKGEGGGGRDYF